MYTSSNEGEMVISGAAFLEHRVEAVLSRTLQGSRKIKKELITGYRARTLLFCLGLISEREFHDLRLIYRIRNVFAHVAPRPSFADDAIDQRCRCLSTYRDGRANRDAFERALWHLVARLSRLGG